MRGAYRLDGGKHHAYFIALKIQSGNLIDSIVINILWG